MTLQETLRDGLKTRSLPDCMQLGINPNGNALGHLPDVPEKDAEQWATLTVELADKISKQKKSQ